MLHFIYWNYRLRAGETVLDGKQQRTRLKIKANAAIKTKLLVSKELAHFSEQIHDGENFALMWIAGASNVMQTEDVSEQLTTIEETILKLAEQEKRNC
jgi:exonuclease SbcC